MKTRISLFVVLTLGLLVFAIGASPTVARADNPSPLPIAHQVWNGVVGPITENGDGAVPQGGVRIPATTICSTATSTDPNVNTDCQGTTPHNETSLAIDPNNSAHRVGSANDYQLTLSNGGRVYETVYSRAHVTFDAGQTWTTYAIHYDPYTSTGDPAVAFDGSGNVYLATLGFLWSQGNGCCVNPDVLVAHSSDGGKTWSNPVRVQGGSGSFGSVGLFNDKEYLTAWGNGNAIVTWTEFNDGIGGSYISSPIFASVTHDGGNTWSNPVEISGSASFCVGAQGGTKCDQSTASVPVVAADGSIYVTFLNEFDLSTGRDQYLVVKVDPNTGARIAGPFLVGHMVDGLTDYPVNVDGRQTYHDSEFRTWSAGNIAADPTNPAHLAVIWSDMRNSTLPAPSDPFQANTNSDVIVSQSSDGGQTWSSPAALVLPNDQFMPWGAYDGSGLLRIGFFDRQYDPANHAYGYTIATETAPGSLSFNYVQATTALSDPTQGTRWFSGGVVNHATTFIGDYSNIAIAGSSPLVAAYWTDLRNTVTFPPRTGTGEDAYYGTTP